LDGNVKRVLARHEALAGDPARSEVLRRFWDVAERYTPVERTANYNQAMMDLGATLCTRSRPACGICPVNDSCRGHAE
ncbi:A/G-specific adenine glycosylase, partial [Acinetobacter baumannii]